MLRDTLSLCHVLYSGSFSIWIVLRSNPYALFSHPQLLFVYAAWRLGQEQFWMSWEEKRQDFYYNALFIIGSIWSMSTCQICNIIWEPADGAVTDSIQRFVYSPEHVFPSWGKYHFIVRAEELFVARCWTCFFLLSQVCRTGRPFRWRAQVFMWKRHDGSLELPSLGLLTAGRTAGYLQGENEIDCFLESPHWESQRCLHMADYRGKERLCKPSINIDRSKKDAYAEWPLGLQGLSVQASIQYYSCQLDATDAAHSCMEGGGGLLFSSYAFEATQETENVSMFPLIWQVFISWGVMGTSWFSSI